jgi:hypothetical protein
MSVEPDEVHAAFRLHWMTGSVDENWSAWPDRLTEDVRYREHFYGDMHGREAVREWIVGLMAQRADVHAVLDWYIVSGHRLVLNMQNRYYNPDPAGEPFDFPGLTILEYAGDGLFGYQEDYWSQRLAKVAHASYRAAVDAWGGTGLDNGRREQLERVRREQNVAALDRQG